LSSSITAVAVPDAEAELDLVGTDAGRPPFSYASLSEPTELSHRTFPRIASIARKPR
jgi:hypothetical protein